LASCRIRLGDGWRL